MYFKNKAEHGNNFAGSPEKQVHKQPDSDERRAPGFLKSADIFNCVGNSDPTRF